MYGFSHLDFEFPEELRELQQSYHPEIGQYLRLTPEERRQTKTVFESNGMLLRLFEFSPVLNAFNTLGNKPNSIIGRCAFCEQKKALSLHWFRPNGAAQPNYGSLDADYYLWFGFEWSNLFPICNNCGHHDPSFFPVKKERRRPNLKEIYQWELQSSETVTYSELLSTWRKDEEPILIFPGQDGYFDHFDIGSNFKLVGRSERGAVTINHYNLNHPSTVKIRRDHILEYLYGKFPTNNFINLESGGAWLLYLRNFLGVQSAITLAEIANAASDWKETSIGDKKEIAAQQDFSLIQAAFDTDDLFFESLKSTKKKKIDRVQRQLRSIKIENFKSLETIDYSFRDIDHKKIETEAPTTPCLLLLGENANGKSSFLEALTLAAMSKDSRDALREDHSHLNPTRLVTNTKFLGDQDGASKGISRINLEFESEGERIEQSLTISSNGDGSYRTYGNAGDLLIFAFGAHRLFKDKIQAASPIRKSYENVLTLFEPGAGLFDPEKWIVGLNEFDRNELVKALREIIQVDGRFRDIEVVEEAGKKFCQINLVRTNNVFIDGEKEELATGSSKKVNRVIPTPFQYASFGYRVIIALICSVVKGILDSIPAELNPTVADCMDYPVLVIIDEIEVHLHPRWKMEVIAGLRRALPKATFVMSSHDPLCVRGMRNGEVIVFNRYQDDHSMRESVEITEEFPNFDKMTIEDLLTSDLFKMFSTNDRKTEQNLYVWAKLKAKETAGHELNLDEQKKLMDFAEFTQKALPNGMTDVEGLIQDAVASYIFERRKDRETSTNARKLAIEKIKEQLRKIAGDFNA